MNLDKLEKLAKLKEMGVLTDEEFERGKQEAMRENVLTNTLKKSKFGMEDTSYYLLMHLSQFCGIMIPFLGILAPILLWLVQKDDDPVVDEHGRNILNWNISFLIYMVICGVSMFLFIGFILIWIPIILMIIFPIIGAIKASNGEVWKYPLSLKFL